MKDIYTTNLVAICTFTAEIRMLALIDDLTSVSSCGIQTLNWDTRLCLLAKDISFQTVIIMESKWR